MKFTKDWTYQLNVISRGRYDGCIFKIPSFMSKGNKLDLNGLTNDEMDQLEEIELFYNDFLSFIGREYKDKVSELGVAISDVKKLEDIRLPSWFHEYRSILKKTGELPGFTYEQQNEFAILHALTKDKQDLTPEGNKEVFKEV